MEGSRVPPNRAVADGVQETSSLPEEYPTIMVVVVVVAFAKYFFPTLWLALTLKSPLVEQHAMDLMSPQFFGVELTVKLSKKVSTQSL